MHVSQIILYKLIITIIKFSFKYDFDKIIKLKFKKKNERYELQHIKEIYF